jgi:hypothetical protein
MCKMKNVITRVEMGFFGWYGVKGYNYRNNKSWNFQYDLAKGLFFPQYCDIKNWSFFHIIFLKVEFTLKITPNFSIKK